MKISFEDLKEGIYCYRICYFGEDRDILGLKIIKKNKENVKVEVVYSKGKYKSKIGKDVWTRPQFDNHNFMWFSDLNESIDFAIKSYLDLIEESKAEIKQHKREMTLLNKLRGEWNGKG